jgi:hypothetical protein
VVRLLPTFPCHNRTRRIHHHPSPSNAKVNLDDITLSDSAPRSSGNAVCGYLIDGNIEYRRVGVRRSFWLVAKKRWLRPRIRHKHARLLFKKRRRDARSSKHGERSEYASKATPRLSGVVIRNSTAPLHSLFVG